jgi:DNA-binding NtrC family response regulator
VLLFLSFEKSLRDMLREVLQAEGYTVKVTHSAKDTLKIVERTSGQYVVVMDNYRESGEARTFAKTVFARPELHARVRVVAVGLAVQRWEQLADLDAYVKMPFAVAELLDPIARLCAELEAED